MQIRDLSLTCRFFLKFSKKWFLFNCRIIYTLTLTISGFKTLHSTESALLKVFNDILITTDAGDTMALVLLDLSSAFDIVEHRILLSRLERSIDITGTVLPCFLSDRSFSVSLGVHSSSVAPITCGVPLGSILGPLLFTLYMLPLGSIMSKFGVSYHCYADDTQLYIPIKRKDKLAYKRLEACLHKLKLWLTSNFMFPNHDNPKSSNLDQKRTRTAILLILAPLRLTSPWTLKT